MAKLLQNRNREKRTKWKKNVKTTACPQRGREKSQWKKMLKGQRMISPFSSTVKGGKLGTSQTKTNQL